MSETVWKITVCCLILLGMGLALAGVFGMSAAITGLRDDQARMQELLHQDKTAVIQIFETPDHRWQIRVARPADGLFEIAPIDPENLPGGQPIGQKPGI